MISESRYSMKWLTEEENHFKGLSDDFFDDLINHLEDIDSTNGEGDWDAKFQDLEPPPMDMFLSLPFTSCGISNGGRNTLPILKKQSNSSEALSSINITHLHQSSSSHDIKVSKLFQSLSPVSVLESIEGSSSPQNALPPRLTFPVKGIRSKRKRPTRLRCRYIFPSGSRETDKLTPGESESHSYHEQHAKKKRKIHLVFSSLEASNSDWIVRKCTHCETTKTPQWREGPNGPKTLCNACGVRFRSGRLVPEYRPVSSPTFIPSVHSNSHRKIMEMRRKDEDQFDIQPGICSERKDQWAGQF